MGDTLVLDTPGSDTLVLDTPGLDTPGLDTLAWDMAVDTTLVRGKNTKYSNQVLRVIEGLDTPSKGENFYNKHKNYQKKKKKKKKKYSGSTVYFFFQLARLYEV